MSVSEVLVDGNGRAVLVKRARAADDVAHLRHEAEMLRAARHPGVVELLDVVDDGEHVSLTLRWAGSHTLATVGRLPVDRTAGIVVALTSAVADLHDAGISHNRIEPDHVVLVPSGRPLLCGLGHAGPRSEASAAADVAGLGAVLRHLVGDDEGDLLPGWRFGWRGRTDADRRSLLNLADHATADEPSSRPSARALADAIHAAVPDARLGGAGPAESEGGAEADGSRGERRWRRWVGAAAALLLLGIGALAVVAAATTTWRPGRSGADRAAAPPSTTTRSTTTTSPAPTTTTTTLTTTTTVAAEGDGTVEVDGVRYAVGRPGDLVLVGDWGCDDRSRAAVLRPSTSEVFLFERWAEPGRPLVVEVARRLPGANGLHGADVDRDGCLDVVVTGADGATTVVR